MKILKKYTLWMALTLILLVALVVSIFTAGFSNLGILPIASSDIGKDKAAEISLAYINENLLGGTNTALLDSVEDTGDTYKMTLKISGQKFESYVTKDGKYLFPQGVDMTQSEETETETKTETKNDLPKTEKPVVEVFVMSHCPYGTQIEKGIIPVTETLGDKIDFSIKFVNYAMHGEKEIKEQLNQYCIQKDFNDKYLDYLKCFLKEGNGDACITEVGLDKNKISTCATATDTEFKVMEGFNDKSTWLSGAYPQFNVHNDLNEKYGVQGSPTLIINGVEANSGRDSASLLKTVCGAFETEPSECKEALSADTPSPGFGYTTGTSDSGSCA